MKHLSGLDASFLHLETPEMPMHVGGLNLFDLPDGYTGDFYEDVKQHVINRMHLASVFSKKLALMPFEVANPVWIDDDAVDLDYHIRKIHLPKPGSMAQLEAYVGRLHSSLLDRSRPLWEFYVFDGLENGQAAFYSKIHHAALDGQGAAVMAQALLDISPVPREVPPPRLKRRGPYQPRVGDLINAALRDTMQQCWRILKGVPSGVRAAGDLLKTALENRSAERHNDDSKLRDAWSLAPKTPLNVSITNQRVFATAKIPLSEAKLIGKVLGASLNDVVLAICSGALREWLASKAALPSKTLVAAMPVSLRAEGDTELNNQVSMMRMQLASHIADPSRRLQSIVRNSEKLKRTLKSVKSVLPTDFPSLGLPWLMSGLVALYGRVRLADKIHPLANVVISNVPGPQMDLYLAGAKMATNYPVSIVAHGLALNITVQSYAGALDFGLIACRKAMPDVQNFAQLMQEAHQQLLEVAKATQLSARQNEAQHEELAQASAGKLASAKPVSRVAKTKKAPPSEVLAPVVVKKLTGKVAKADKAVSPNTPSKASASAEQNGKASASATKPSATKPSAKASAVKASAVKASATKAVSAKPAQAKSTTAKSATAKPQAEKPSIAKPRTARKPALDKTPEVVKAEVVKAEVVTAEAGNLNAPQPEISNTAVAEAKPASGQE